MVHSLKRSAADNPQDCSEYQDGPFLLPAARSGGAPPSPLQWIRGLSPEWISFLRDSALPRSRLVATPPLIDPRNWCRSLASHLQPSAHTGIVPDVWRHRAHATVVLV